MAFSTTNVQSGMLFNGVKILCGDWSGTVGDAPGTMTLAGGRVYNVVFRSEDTTPSPQEDPDATITTSGSTITLTIYNHLTVTNGRFFIVYS